MNPIFYHHGWLKRSKRRFTVAASYSEDLTELCLAVAICSKKDTFKKSIGRAIAEARLTHPDRAKMLERGCLVTVATPTELKPGNFFKECYTKIEEGL